MWQVGDAKNTFGLLVKIGWIKAVEQRVNEAWHSWLTNRSPFCGEIFNLLPKPRYTLATPPGLMRILWHESVRDWIEILGDESP